MIKTFRLAVLSVLLITPILLGAQTARLRLGSVLPANSLWDRSLKEMANGWQQATDRFMFRAENETWERQALAI